MKYYVLILCFFASSAAMQKSLNDDTPLLPITRNDAHEISISDRRWRAVRQITQGFAADALGAGFFYAAFSGTGDSVMVPILYGGGLGFIAAGGVIAADGFRKLCCGAAQLCKRR